MEGGLSLSWRPLSRNEVLHEPIWRNPLLRDINFHPLDWSRLEQSSVKTIGGIWSSANCRFLTATEISQDLSLGRSISKPKLQIITNSIHDEWIQLLRIGDTAEGVQSTVLPHPLSIKVDVVSLDIRQLSHKAFLTATRISYCTSVKFLRPLHRWNDFFQEDIDWDYVWRLTNTRLVYRKVADFSWKIARNAVPVHVKVSDDPQKRQCRRCLQTDETIEHLIWECPF